MPADHYDLIVIGTGPGGASLAHRLAPTGKRILMLERGDYLPRSRDELGRQDGVRRRPLPGHRHLVRRGRQRRFHPGLHYYVGGNSKVYGAALLRLRERDFGELQHTDGLSPGLAGRLRRVRALLRRGRGAVPRARPARRRPDRAPVQRALPLSRRSSHEPRIQQLSDSLAERGPASRSTCRSASCWTRTPTARPTTDSPCIRCDAFDGFPCVLNAKADAQVICVDPTLARAPQRHAADRRLCRPGSRPTRRAGRVTAVHVDPRRPAEQYSADIVVVACGALSSALLLLRSASDAHPNGLANGSDQVGRNYMRHNMSASWPC